jgi:Circularly permutated YpsA SLOG family
MTSVRRIISGGQTGADQGALAAAKRLGLPTGGWMPRGFMTEAGRRTDFATLYGMHEHPEANSVHRTETNVREADGTLIVGDADAGGSRDTKEFCIKHAKPCYVLPWRVSQPVPVNAASDVRDWLAQHEIRILNVAGDRESKAPGIHDAVLAFLLTALAEL